MARLYVVDDHALVRDGLRAMLSGSGHEVIGEAPDAATALCEVDRLAPDLVLLDLCLGESHGLELLIRLRQRERPIATLVLTASTRPRDVAEALRHGAAGYLLKDSGRAVLQRAVDAVLRGQTFLGPEVAGLAADALTARETDPVAMLSLREREVLMRVVRGESSAAIGRAMALSPKTVDTYRSRLMHKLGVADVTALVRLAVRHGLVDAAAS